MSNGNHLPDKPAENENESRLGQEQREHINEGLAHSATSKLIDAKDATQENRNTEDSEKTLDELFDERLATLPADVKALFPDENNAYYKKTNEMHCDISKPGGSKFVEISTIADVLAKDAGRIPREVEIRRDDRQALMDEGANPAAFLPAVKSPDDPEGLPEALYYKVEGIKGKLGIVQLQELNPEELVIVRREKSAKDEQGKEKVPCSLSVIKESLKDMPDTDFATVIVGRKGGEQGRDEVWTIHPGAPIKPVQGDFLPEFETLPGPQDGEKQRVIIVTVKDLLDTGKMTEQDYVKVIQGKQEDVLSQYSI